MAENNFSTEGERNYKNLSLPLTSPLPEKTHQAITQDISTLAQSKPRTPEERARDLFEDQGIISPNLVDIPPRLGNRSKQKVEESLGAKPQYTGKYPISFNPENNATVRNLLSQGATQEDFLPPRQSKKKPVRKPYYGKKG